MMTLRMLVRAAITAMIAVCVANPASAQRPHAELRDSVPRALAEALLAPSFQRFAMMGGDDGRPRLIVGTLPASLAERLWIPPEAVVLGGLESNAGGIGVLRSHLGVDSLAARYRREQLSLGWTPPPPPRESGSIWGFLPAHDSLGASLERLMLCSGGALLTIDIESVGADVREISAHAATMGYGICDRQSPEAAPWVAMQRSFHPTLTNPPGTGDGLQVVCADFSAFGRVGETRLRTSSSIEEVLAHYGAQLADSGWTVATADQIVSRSWTRRDRVGVLVEITLTARRAPAAPRCVEVQMQVNTRVGG